MHVMEGSEVQLKINFDFGSFLVNNIRYPSEDRSHNIQGKVFVTFVIERDGTVTDIRILRAPSETLANEALRVMHLCPVWIPGFQHGEPVRVQYTVPIAFTLNGKRLD